MADLYRHRDYRDQLWVRLYVSKKRLRRTFLNCLTPGYYLFSGMWYGNDPSKISSFGKIIPVDNAVKVGSVRSNIPAVTLRRLQ